MNNSLIAGLDSSNMDDWNGLVEAYGLDEFPTGGMPAIPANAENTGIVDPRTFAVGTIINVYTRSCTKYALTVVENGEVTIERFSWGPSLAGGFQLVSHEELVTMYKILLTRHKKNLALQEQGFDVNVGDLPIWPHFSPYFSDYTSDNAFQVEEIQAGKPMEIRRHGNEYSSTTPVAFWSIDTSTE